ncbi:hypothetical protein [Bradyrhizobium sp.]|jgi:hypothetical protein|uniref:hypothetical protein n=1 Tax=Bradyrhizobium sp. TaxID=376 RepID=UPI003BB22062
MVPTHSHDHAHPHHHPHSHSHGHGHGPAAPHPAQAVTWSILRMAVVSRLMAAAVVSAALWAFVWLAMK